MATPPFSSSPSPAVPAGPSPTARAAQPNAGITAQDQRRTLVIGRGIRVICAVKDAERIVVEGEFATNLVRASAISVAPGGTFHGNAEIVDADVAGTIDGTLTVSGKLIVHSTGVLLGTTRCAHLQVEEGGQITGDLEMAIQRRE